MLKKAIFVIMSVPHSHRGFKYGLTALVSLAGFIGLNTILIFQGIHVPSLLLGVVTLCIFALGILGLIASLRGLKEPNTLKKIIGLFLNLGFLALSVAVIVANVLDMIRAFSN